MVRPFLRAGLVQHFLGPMPPNQQTNLVPRSLESQCLMGGLQQTDSCTKHDSFVNITFELSTFNLCIQCVDRI